MDVWKQFEENDITHSAAHHILAIYELRKDRGYARVTDVAKHLNITSGSASTNLKALKQKGLIKEDDNRFLALSDQGEALARAVTARRDIFKKFLAEILNVSPEQAEVDACKTEHLISHETSEKLLAFMQILDKKFGKKASLILQDVDACKNYCPVDASGHGVDQCKVCDDHCLLEDC